LKFGARFSRKDDMPSDRSFVEKSSMFKSASNLKPSLSGKSPELLMASFIYFAAIEPLLTIRSLISLAVRANSLDGIISVTSPAFNAFSAVIGLPVKSIWVASPSPIRRGSRCVPPSQGMSPSCDSGKPNEEFVEAIRISHAKAISNPCPCALPSTAAMVGFVMRDK